MPDYVTEKRFAEPVLTSDVLLRTLRELAEVLAATMERHGKGARRLEASFFRTDGMVRVISVDAGQAVTDAAVALRLFNERLDALADPLDPGFGFDLVRLAASQTASVTSTQYGFDPAAHEADDVARLIDRLSARLGANRVIRYVPQDTHIPEYAVMRLPAQRKLADDVGWLAHPPHEPPNRPLRLFEMPERIKVGFALVPDGPPTSFLWRQLTASRHPRRGPRAHRHGVVARRRQDADASTIFASRTSWACASGCSAKVCSAANWCNRAGFCTGCSREFRSKA